MVEVILTDAEHSFQPLSPVRFKVDRMETNPRFATITRPANAAILIDLKLDMEGRGGLLQILLPYATIEPIRDLLLQSFMGERLGRDPVWEEPLATEIWQADVEVEAVLHEMRLPLERCAFLAGRRHADVRCKAERPRHSALRRMDAHPGQRSAGSTTGSPSRWRVPCGAPARRSPHSRRRMNKKDG